MSTMYQPTDLRTEDPRARRAEAHVASAAAAATVRARLGADADDVLAMLNLTEVVAS